MDRRAEQDERTKLLIDQALLAHSSFRKNGHSWGQWFERMLSPERILLVAILIFNAGGWWTNTKVDLTAQQERTRVMQAQHEKIVEEMIEMRGIQKLHAEMYAAQGEQLKVAAHAADAARRQVEAVSAQQKTAITRQEFQAALRQQLVPRLDRIEKTLPQ